jgi:hypothetical protein
VITDSEGNNKLGIHILEILTPQGNVLHTGFMRPEDPIHFRFGIEYG